MIVGGAYWTAFRPRSQVFGAFPYRAPTRDKVVALTFDDGPNEPYTSRLLDVLDERGVKATFFQVGRCAERFPSCTRRVVESGHLLGNHSYSHSFTSYVRQPRQRDEIRRTQEILHTDRRGHSGAVPAAVAVSLAVGAGRRAPTTVCRSSRAPSAIRWRCSSRRAG